MINTNVSVQNGLTFRVLTDDQIWEIRQAAFEVIEKSGFTCLHEQARKMLAAAGAVVDDQRPRMQRRTHARAADPVDHVRHLGCRRDRRGCRSGDHH